MMESFWSQVRSEWRWKAPTCNGGMWGTREGCAQSGLTRLQGLKPLRWGGGNVTAKAVTYKARKRRASLPLSAQAEGAGYVGVEARREDRRGIPRAKEALGMTECIGRNRGSEWGWKDPTCNNGMWAPAHPWDGGKNEGRVSAICLGKDEPRCARWRSCRGEWSR
jgi:hypothetical protein